MTTGRLIITIFTAIEVFFDIDTKTRYLILTCSDDPAEALQVFQILRRLQRSFEDSKMCSDEVLISHDVVDGSNDVVIINIIIHSL